MKDRLLAGTFRYEDYTSVLVSVEFDGQTGWGEAMTRFSPRATASMVGWIGGQLAGSDFSGPEEAWRRVWNLYRVRGQTRGIAVEALSGVEMAMWDAVGKARRRPLGALFGRNRSSEIPAYAGAIFESRGPIEAQVERAKTLGLRGFKLKIGFGLEKDVRLVKKARKLWDDGMMIVDANGAYGFHEAEKLMGRLEQYQPEWLEEPLPPDDFAGYERLSRLRKVPIGAGEAWFPLDFGPILQRGGIDVVEPSVSRCGGISTELGVAKRAEAAGIGFSPMIGINSSLSVAASLHVASLTKCFAIEYDAFENPLMGGLTPGFPKLRRGRMKVPTGNGLGIEVDARFVKSHAASD